MDIQRERDERRARDAEVKRNLRNISEQREKARHNVKDEVIVKRCLSEIEFFQGEILLLLEDSKMKTKLVDLDKICAFYLNENDENSHNVMEELRQERAERVARDAKVKDDLAFIIGATELGSEIREKAEHAWGELEK